MKYGYIYFSSVLISLWITMPVFASPDRVPHFGKNGNAPNPFIFTVQEWEKERGALSYGGSGFRESPDRSSDKDTRSYSEFLGPRFDIPDSVDGHSDRPDPWWGRRSSADPMVEDLSRRDGISGFGSPGSLGR
jgi:hypothetical protein